MVAAHVIGPGDVVALEVQIQPDTPESDLDSLVARVEQGWTKYFPGVKFKVVSMCTGARGVQVMFVYRDPGAIAANAIVAIPDDAMQSGALLAFVGGND